MSDCADHGSGSTGSGDGSAAEPWAAEPGASEPGAAEPWEPQRRDAPGVRLGLPAAGPGSAAGRGHRLLALLIDLVLAGLIAGLFTAPDLPRNWSLLSWFILTAVPIAIAGFTPGKAVMGLRVGRLDGRPVGLWRAAVRTVLVGIVIPAVIWDRDIRGLHDRLVGTVEVRAR